MRARAGVCGLMAGLACLSSAITIATNAGASDPPNVSATLPIVTVKGVTQGAIVETPVGVHPIFAFDQTSPTNPLGISLLRGGNYRIESKSGKRLRLLRAVGNAQDAVFVAYETSDSKNFIQRYVHKIRPDNTAGFDKQVSFEDEADITADGAGGVYLVSHTPVYSGQFGGTQTTPTLYRLSPAGEILWQQSEPAGDMPATGAERAACAARSAQGVFAAYAVQTAADDLRPVVVHRKADGSPLFKRSGLKAPASADSGKPPGALGTQDLFGVPERIVAAADGTAIVVIDRPTALTKTIVRIDAAGTQTAAFACEGQKLQVIEQADSVACVDLRSDGTVKLSRYGVVGGALARVRTWKSDHPGWTFSTATAAGSYYLLAGTAVSSTGTELPAVRLLSSATGERLASELQVAQAEASNALAANDGVWLNLMRGDDNTWTYFRGTYGGPIHVTRRPEATATTKPDLVAKPKARPRPRRTPPG